MILDQLMQFATNGTQSVFGALPDWQTSFDTTQIAQLVQMVQGWDNWLPIHETLICVGIMMAVWVALQGFAIAAKAVELIKP